MRKLTALLFVITLLISCSTAKKIAKKETAPAEVPVTESLNNQFTTLYIEATNYAAIEDYDKSIEIYEKCKLLKPNNAAVYYELSRLYAKKRNAQLAVDNAEKAIELSPKNKWYLLQTATVYRATGQDEKSLEAYEKLIEVDGKNLIVLYELAELYRKNNKLREAANTITKIENITGKNSQLSYQKYLLLMDAGDEKQALEEIGKLLKQNPEDGMGNLAMAQYYQRKGEEDKFYESLIYVFQDPTIRSENKLNIVVDFLNRMGENKEKQEKTLKLIELMLAAHSEEYQPYVAAGDYYGKLNDLKKANEYYEKSLDYATNSYPVYLQILDNSFNLKEYKEVVRFSEKGLELYPTQPTFYLYQGMGYKELGENEKAIKAFRNGQNMVIDNEKLQFELYSKMGDTYHEMKDYANSDKYFDKAMEINGLEPFMLNNYSYYLSLRKDKLEKAADLSRKANNIYPNNASFNDTYGWILFQQKKYEESALWIKKSLDNGGDKSGTVLEHYGDVMSKLNKSDVAVEYWQKAKKTGEHSDSLDKKIKDKKYYE